MDRAAEDAGIEQDTAGRRTNKISRIESLSHRQVAFSKRRTGLLKKAHELSVLCDAQVAVIVFSSTGRLSEFASPSIPVVLERYQESMGNISTRANSPPNIEYWQRQAILLKDRIEVLQLQQSFLLGENITSCHHVEELEVLEQKLCAAINKVEEKKIERFQIDAQEMLKKEMWLRKENDLLKLRIADVESRERLRHQQPIKLPPMSRSLSEDYRNNSSPDGIICCNGSASACSKKCSGMANFLQLGLNTCDE